MEQKETLTRWWDFSAAILLLAALLTAAARLVSTRWTENLSIVQNLVLIGVIIGFALGKSVFSHQTAITLGAAYGTFAVPWQLGLTLEKDLIWRERMQVLINRLDMIIQQLANQEPVQDSLLFIVIMSILFWTLSVHAGFTLVRYGSAWGSILPSGLAIFLIHSFDAMVTRRSWYLALYLFFGLILVARMVYIQRQERWQTNRTALPPHLGLDFIRFAIVATLLIILFSWTVPALANALPAAQKVWQPVERAWNETRDRFDNAFASLRTSVGLVSQYYGVSATLGRGTPLSDDHIFTARAPDNLPPSVRLYWRARTYDTYESGQWFSAINTVYTYNPEDDELPLPVEAGRWFGTFDIVSAVNLSTLYMPPQPVWTSQPGQVEYALNPDGTLDISTFRAIPSVDPGDVYETHASISYATESKLMAAGSIYPDWIVERYLSLPDTITPRTRQLAADITAGLETPYEKTVAITDFLRQNIEYVETIEDELPNDQDLIDWFLFDYQKGFCNYYATAEVVLLRTLGIPARWAVGYAEGERIIDENEATRGNRFSGGSFIVRQKDAHAWPEVYFPSIGWVEFEPTAAQPNILRLPGGPNEGTGVVTSSEIEEMERLRREMEEEMALLRQQRQSSQSADNENPIPPALIYWALVLFSMGLILYALWKNRKKLKFQPFPILLEKAYIRAGLQPPLAIKRWALQAALPPLVKAYHEINKALARLGMKPPETITPTERAAILTGLIPQAEKPVRELVHEYEREVFGRQRANLVVAIRSAGDIRRFSNSVSVRNLINRLPNPLKLLRNSKHDVKSQV